jgi:hypothetical protein
MSEYKIELVLKTDHSVIGEAIDEGTALKSRRRQYGGTHAATFESGAEPLSSLSECRLGTHDDLPRKMPGGYVVRDDNGQALGLHLLPRQ